MIRHYILFTYRLFKTRIGSVGLNILGLSLGFFTSLSALYLMTTEIGYNAQFPENESIARIVTYANNYETAIALTAYNLAPAISASYPEITSYCRTSSLIVDLDLDNNSTFEDEVLFVDTSFIGMFGHELILGDPQKALQSPNSLILTEKYARKLFGKNDPIGQILTILWYKYNTNLTVTGVIKNPKRKSTISFNLLGNLSLAREYSKNWNMDVGKSNGDGWIDMRYLTYIKVRNRNSLNPLLDKINQHAIEDYPGYFDLSYRSQPIRDIYFSTMEVQSDPAPHGNKLYLLIIVLIGFIILFISSFNFIILSTSQAVTRSREFGIRKVFGANRKYIMVQTISEYVLYSLIAILLALVLLELFYPELSQWFGKGTEFSLFNSPFFLPGLVLVMLVTVFFSTFYLNYFISASSPIKSIAGLEKKKNFRFSSHSILIGIQLLFFCVIFTSLLSINKQIRYINNSDSGLIMENLVVLSNPVISKERDKFEIYKDKVLSDNKIISITTANSPSLPSHLIEFFPMNVVGKEDQIDDVYCDMINVNYDFLKTFGIQLKSGRAFTEENFLVRKNCCLITQSCVEELKISDPIGSVISVLNGEMHAEIVGVVEDFYVTSYYKRPKPIVLFLDPDFIDYYYVRLREGEKTSHSIQWLKEKWEEVFPGYTFNYSLYTENYTQLYDKANSTIKIVVVFSLFALILSLIGLYGMSNHISNLKVKEMSLRHLYGASISKNFQTIVKPLFFLTIICNIISIPISIVVSRLWLNQFFFHTSISYTQMLITFGFSIMVLFLAIGGNMYRSVNRPVVEVLKERG